VVESTADPKSKPDCVLDIHARVKSGGDAQGMRIFTLDARTSTYAKEWMEQLCRASEILELKKTARGWQSSVSPEMVARRNAKRSQTASIFAVGGTPAAPGAGGGASAADAHSVEDHHGGGSHLAEMAKRSPLGPVLGRGRGRGFGRGTRGSGGRGSGVRVDAAEVEYEPEPEAYLEEEEADEGEEGGVGYEPRDHVSEGSRDEEGRHRRVLPGAPSEALVHARLGLGGRGGGRGRGNAFKQISSLQPPVASEL
jgi:hypothetical protein